VGETGGTRGRAKSVGGDTGTDGRLVNGSHSPSVTPNIKLAEGPYTKKPPESKIGKRGERGS